MSPNKIHAFYIETFGGCGIISQTFHADIFRLLETGFIELYTIFPLLFEATATVRKNNGR